MVDARGRCVASSGEKRPGNHGSAQSDTRMEVDVVASALVEMGAPGSVHIGDWACPYGHFNTRLKRECARCVNEDRRVNATERYKVAVDEQGKLELMDFVQQGAGAESLSPYLNGNGARAGGQ